MALQDLQEKQPKRRKEARERWKGEGARTVKKEKLKEILCKQMELIAEASKECEPKELAELSNSMSTLCLTHQQIDFH